MRHHLGRSRVATAGLLLPLTLLLAACSEEDEQPTTAPPVSLPEDLCEPVQAALDPELGLGDAVASSDPRSEDQVSAGCVLTGPRGARAEVTLTSYALADADDPVEPRLARESACDQLLSQEDLVDPRKGEFDCDAGLPDGSFSSVDELIAQQGVLRIELTLPGLAPEQVAAYGTALGGELRDL